MQFKYSVCVCARKCHNEAHYFVQLRYIFKRHLLVPNTGLKAKAHHLQDFGNPPVTPLTTPSYGLHPTDEEAAALRCLTVLSLNFCCFWADGAELEATLLRKARSRAGLGGPSPPCSTAVLPASHLERGAGGRGPEGGSHTYYGHLGDEDPPDGIGHPKEESQAV